LSKESGCRRRHRSFRALFAIAEPLRLIDRRKYDLSIRERHKVSLSHFLSMLPMFSYLSYTSSQCFPYFRISVLKDSLKGWRFLLHRKGYQNGRFFQEPLDLGRRIRSIYYRKFERSSSFLDSSLTEDDASRYACCRQVYSRPFLTL